MQSEMRVLPKGVIKASGDWTSIYFALAIGIWAFKILIETAWVAGIFLWDPPVRNSAGFAVIGIDPDYNPWELKMLISALLSIINSWLLLMTVRTVYFIPEKNNNHRYRSHYLITTFDWLFKITHGARRFYEIQVLVNFSHWVLFLASLILSTIILWYYEVDAINGWFDLNIPDLLLALYVGYVMAYTFFYTFLDRGHMWLALFIIPILMIAVIQTIIRGVIDTWPPNVFAVNLFNQAMEQATVSYKFVLIPILIMLTVSYLTKLQETARQKESENYDALHKARINISHRVKNQLKSINARMNILNNRPRFKENSEATVVLKKAKACVSGALKVHELIETNTRPSQAEITQANSNRLFTALMRAIWIDAFGHSEQDLIIKNQIDENILIDRNRAGELQEVLFEVLCNINEHAYRKHTDQRILQASAITENHVLTIVLIDQGIGFHNEYLPHTHKSYGMGLITSTVKNMSGTINFCYAKSDSLEFPGTICTISIPLITSHP